MKDKKTKLVVFSICKDEGKTIGELLDRIPKSIDGIDEIETLVVSDGSTDDTVKTAKEHGAKTIEGTTQKRLAFRFQEAVEKALEMGADVAVNIDGDLQFMPEDIPKLLEPITKGNYDFVAGDRFTDIDGGHKRKPENMPLGKYLANRLGSWIVGKLSDERFEDVTSGFRAYNKEALLSINLNSRYTYTQESFQVLAMKNLHLTSVPVKVVYYEGRKSRVVTSFMQFLFGSALNILRASRDFAPLSFFGWLGFIPLLIGAGLSGFVIYHWINTGQFTPYKVVGFAGVYLVSLGLVVWTVGLMADIFNRVLNNQEKILYQIKKNRYEPFEEDSKE